jgi:predicted secreted protein
VIGRILIPTFFLCLIVGVSFSRGAGMVTVDKAFNGKEIDLNAGDVFRVELEQLGAAGYVWEIDDLDRDHFEILSVSTPDPRDEGDIVGGPLLKTWLIKTKKVGTAELKFLYYRVWEGKQNALDTFVLKVRIQKHP